MADGPHPRSRRSLRGAGSLAHHRGIKGSLYRFWQKSYASDYIVIIILFVLEVLIQVFVEPFHRMFTIDDLAIQYPHADPERVPPIWLLLYAAGIPLLVITLWAVITRPPIQKTHVTYLGLLLSVFLTGLLTDIIKNAVGRPRPDLLSRCSPPENAPHNTLLDMSICTTPPSHLLSDGFRSFPSGHSSFSFSGLGYLSLFIAAQTHALHPRTPLPVACLPLLPLVGAILITLSRLQDYRHDVWDVCAGSLLGTVVALGSYRRYFPSLWARGAEESFGYREELWGENDKIRDERRDGSRRRMDRGSGSGSGTGSGSKDEEVALGETEFDVGTSDDSEDEDERRLSGARVTVRPA